MSLRMKLLIEGYGPAVSVGDTAHAALDVPVAVVVVVVAVLVVELGLVGVSPPHAHVSAAPVRPSAPNASRRVIFLEIMLPPRLLRAVWTGSDGSPVTRH
jgi:hypothetical protein